MREHDASMLLHAVPNAATVYCRAHGLGALIQRWEFEQTIQGFDELSIVEIHKGMVADLGRWVDAQGLKPYMTESELALLGVPLGHWKPDLVEAVGWRVETLGVLVWSLGLVKALPSYDRRCVHDDLLIRLRMGKSLEPQRETAQLLPTARMLAALQAAQLWEWRAQTADVMRHPDRIPAGVDLEAFIISQTRSARQQSIIPEPIDNDFPALGHPYRALSEEQTTVLSSIAAERAAALRWLCGSTTPPRAAA